MHGLQPLENCQFGSKTKTLKIMRKTSLEPQQNCSMQNSTAKMALYSLSNQCSKIIETCQSAWAIANVLCKTPLLKTPNIRKITSVLELENFSIMDGLQPLQTRQFRSKIKILKKMRKTSVEPRENCSMKKSIPKNALYSQRKRCSKIGKICINAWAIAFAKTLIWVKN